MLQTVEAEIDVNGNVRLLEPLRVARKARAIVTVLEETNEAQENEGNGRQLLELLKSPEFADRKSYTADEIEAQINKARNSWELPKFISMPASLSTLSKSIRFIQVELKP